MKAKVKDFGASLFKDSSYEYTHFVRIRLNRAQLRFLQAIAKREGITYSKFFRHILDIMSGYRPCRLDELIEAEASGYYAVQAKIFEGMGRCLEEIARIAKAEECGERGSSEKSAGGSAVEHWRRVEEALDVRERELAESKGFKEMADKLEEALKSLKEEEVKIVEKRKKG